MATLVPVENDPFAVSPATISQSQNGPKLVPVDHDPFALQQDQYAAYRDNPVMKEWGNIDPPSGVIQDVANQSVRGSITAFPNLASFPAQIGQWLGDKAIGGIEYMRGADPKETQARLDRMNAGQSGSMLDPASLGRNVGNLTGIGEPQTFAGGVANTAANILPTMMTGGGEIKLGQKLISALGAGTGNEVVKEGVPDDVAIKPYLQFGAAVLGGGGAHLASEMMQPSAASIIAKSVQTNPKALSTIAQSVGDVPAARSTIESLGPEAMVANLTPQVTQDARALAAMSLPNSPKIQTIAQAVLDNSGNRASQDLASVTGPAKSRFDKAIETATAKYGTSNLYEIAKGRTVDATPLYDTLPKIANEVKSNPQASANINEIQKMVTDQVKGNDRIHDAGDLMGVRQRIDEMITDAGRSQTITPGVDLYSVGQKTTTGRALVAVRKSINETLHQDGVLKEADAVFTDASRAERAFEIGNKNIIGTGDSVMEPQAIAALRNRSTPMGNAALLEGLGRKFQNAIGDMKTNRNAGKSVADTIATENNLARLDAMGLDSGTVRNMANREDALAANNNRILSGSDTARTEITKQKFPSAGDPVGGFTGKMTDILSAGMFGAGAATLNPVLAGLAGVPWLAKMGIQKMVNNSRLKTNNAAADLVSRQGPAASSLLDAIEKLNLSKQAKSDILSRLARQSAISGSAALINNPERH